MQQLFLVLVGVVLLGLFSGPSSASAETSSSSANPPERTICLQTFPVQCIDISGPSYSYPPFANLPSYGYPGFPGICQGGVPSPCNAPWWWGYSGFYPWWGPGGFYPWWWDRVRF